jgi:hypothetical protein
VTRQTPYTLSKTMANQATLQVFCKSTPWFYNAGYVPSCRRCETTEITNVSLLTRMCFVGMKQRVLGGIHFSISRTCETVQATTIVRQVSDHDESAPEADCACIIVTYNAALRSELHVLNELLKTIDVILHSQARTLMRSFFGRLYSFHMVSCR